MSLLILFGVLIASYLIGSIPTAYIFGKLLKGVDIRKFGSGNVGATNAMRLLGKKAGITVLLLDILKGFTAVFFLSVFLGAEGQSASRTNLLILTGLACIAGHNWTIFLGFKGGKGIATTLGVLIGLAVKIPGLYIVLAILLGVWLIVFLLFRVVSIASIAATISLPILMILFQQPLSIILLSTLLCAALIFRHKSNIKRIIQKKESRLF